MSCSRRHFLVALGAATAAVSVTTKTDALAGPALLYPPANLSYFDVPLHHGPAKIRIGYAAITWKGNDKQAIDDISSLGYPGIQLRANVLKEYPDPHALKDLLAEHHLEFVALSSGNTPLDPALQSNILETHANHARYLHEAGGKYLQIIGASSKGQNFIAQDYKREGKLLTEIGKRAADYGIKTGFHNHMGTIGQSPGQVDAIMGAADPQYVKLELDVAHYQQGGGDPAAAIRKYDRRLLFLHLKDVEPANTKNGYQFVELGQGRVNFVEIFDALRSIHFRGWGVVELDRERPGSTNTPKESAEMSKEYLSNKLGVKI